MASVGFLLMSFYKISTKQVKLFINLLLNKVVSKIAEFLFIFT